MKPEYLVSMSRHPPEKATHLNCITARRYAQPPYTWPLAPGSPISIGSATLYSGQHRPVHTQIRDDKNRHFPPTFLIPADNTRTLFPADNSRTRRSKTAPETVGAENTVPVRQPHFAKRHSKIPSSPGGSQGLVQDAAVASNWPGSGRGRTRGSPAGGWARSRRCWPRSSSARPRSARPVVMRAVLRTVQQLQAGMVLKVTAGEGLSSSRRHHLNVPRPLTPESPSRLHSRIFAASMAFAVNRPARLSRPSPFPGQAASLLPGSLAITRTGLPPAGDDELPIRS